MVCHISCGILLILKCIRYQQNLVEITNPDIGTVALWLFFWGFQNTLIRH